MQYKTLKIVALHDLTDSISAVSVSLKNILTRPFPLFGKNSLLIKEQ